MDRVSTSFAMKAATAEFLRSQLRQVEAQRQVSTGKKATDLRGFGRDATTLTAARTVQARVDAFLENSKSLVTRLDTQNLALDRLRGVADSARAAVGTAISSGRADTLMIELNNWFGQAAQALNTTHDGNQLFSGGRIDVKAVQVGDLAGLAALPTVGDAFHNDRSAPSSRLDESTTAVSGFLADEVATEFFTILRDIQNYHAGPSGPLNGQLTDAQSTFLEGKLSALGKAHEGLINKTAENGLMQRRVDDAVEAQSRRASTLTGLIAGVSEVDMADALTRLEQAQMGLQAAAYAINALKSSSLLDLLEP
jgi:flagellar hook-associated protein 3 FlgL